MYQLREARFGLRFKTGIVTNVKWIDFNPFLIQNEMVGNGIEINEQYFWSTYPFWQIKVSILTWDGTESTEEVAFRVFLTFFGKTGATSCKNVEMISWSV